ncbi:MAG: cardiolipin synthase [Sporanaerobacter sp.]|jgi:cardiolipin synthase A/B|uniref:cardiolipin synthase n=1 Tax=Sporanaerobacter sp. TaxID=2010183 RepID=UPI003A0FC702
MNYVVDALKWIVDNILLINILLAILLVFFERRNPTITWLWLMILFFLPGIGFLIYLFLGQDLRKKKMFKIKEEEDAYFKDIVATQEKFIEKNKFNYNDPKVAEYEDIIQLHLMSSESIYTQDNDVELFFSGLDKFNSLLKSIEDAKEYIHMEYYIIRSDTISTRIVEALTRKAKEGVEVKLIYDGMGGRTLPRGFFKELIRAGGEVACFLPPFSPYLSIRINYRNHRKICVVDGKEGYVGGFNIGDEYLGYSKKFGYWRDTHAKIRGTAVKGLQWRFLLDWRFVSGSEIEISEKYFPKISTQGETGIQIVSSGPDSKWTSIKDGYLKMIINARSKVYIQTPYFIPDDSILEALKIAGLSGVDVRVIIPSKPDHPFVYWASLSYIGELLQAGVKFYTYQEGFMHSKVIVMDDVVSSVGTANLDIRSFKLNFEVNAFIYDENINKEITEKIHEDFKKCKEITIEEYEKRSIVVKFKESVSRLLSPIL